MQNSKKQKRIVLIEVEKLQYFGEKEIKRESKSFKQK